MQLRKYIVAILLGSFVGLSWSSPSKLESSGSSQNISMTNTTEAFSLEEAINLTLSNNPELYQYRYLQESLDGQRLTSGLSPAIQAGLDVENFSGSNDFSGTDSAETTVSLSSVIELGSKTQSRVALVDARSRNLEFERQAATLDVLGELTVLYIQSLSTQKNILLAEETVRLSKTMLNVVERRAERGAVSEADVMRAAAALSRAKIRLEAFRRNYQRQKVTLSTFWGDTTPHFSRLSGSLSTFTPSDSFEELYRRAKNSPAISVFASEARLKDAELKLARSQSRMDIGWQLGVRKFQESSDTALVAGISIPLFSGQRNSGAVSVAMAERNVVEYQKADALLSLYDRLFSAHSQREENLAAIDLINSELIPSLEKAMNQARIAYENGRYSYQEWIVAQEELLSAKQQRIETGVAIQVNQALIEQLIAEPLK